MSWVEAYALSHSMTFSGVIHLAVAHLIESEFTKMSDVGKLLEVLEWQSRELEAVVMNVRIASSGTVPTGREIVAKHERQLLYDQVLSMLRTLLEISDSKDAEQNPQLKIDALLAANALTRTAEAIANDYERSVTYAHVKLMQDYIERLRQASGESNPRSPEGT